MPTLDDILPKLTSAKVFSTLDAQNGFYHLKLDDESSYLTTFDTPFGRYRWKRLCFGISVAPELFQSRIHAALSGLRGVHCIADDILVTGSGPDNVTAQRDHDQNLIALLQRCRKVGLRLNRNKVRLNRPSVSFMGMELSAAGLHPSAQKIEAVKAMPIPEDRAALQRFFGFCYISCQILPSLQ